MEDDPPISAELALSAPQPEAVDEPALSCCESEVSAAPPPEERAPMLDVHMPHATHTWKDFFIHVGTICVGLLIAVGLEQLVEHIHQRFELRETREAIVREREANHKDMEENARNWRWELVELQNDLLVLRTLQQHPGTPQSKLPGDLLFIQYPVLTESAAWTAADKSGILRLMPGDEANANAALYEFLDVMGKQGLDEYNAFNDASRFDVADGDPSHLTPEQLARTIDAVEIALVKHVLVGNSLAYQHNHFPDVASDLTYEEVGRVHHQPFRETPEDMKAAHQLTVDRLVKAGFPIDSDAGFVIAPTK
jgi:hypothetical protein